MPSDPFKKPGFQVDAMYATNNAAHSRYHIDVSGGQLNTAEDKPDDVQLLIGKTFEGKVFVLVVDQNGNFTGTGT